MEVIGYSERGVINSLFHEIKYSQNNIELLNEFLSLISFPSCRLNYQISDAKILMEQSFSGFGSPDIILMVNNNEKKQAIFIEAKVKAFQHWNISEEFNKFESKRRESLKGYTPKDSKGLDVKNWGYISWADIEKFCEKNNLGETLKVFKFNEGQIYERKKRGNSR